MVRSAPALNQRHPGLYQYSPRLYRCSLKSERGGLAPLAIQVSPMQPAWR